MSGILTHPSSRKQFSSRRKGSLKNGASSYLYIHLYCRSVHVRTELYWFQSSLATYKKASQIHHVLTKHVNKIKHVWIAKCYCNVYQWKAQRDVSIKNNTMFFIIKYSFLSMAVIMTSIVMDSKTIRKHAIIIIIIQGGRGKLFILLVPKVV